MFRVFRRDEFQPNLLAPLAAQSPLNAPSETLGTSQQLGVAAWRVWGNLEPENQEILRDEARDGVDPIFWDRLEVPKSPLALRLWEIVQREFPADVAAEWPRSEAETTNFFAPLLPDEVDDEENSPPVPADGQLSLEIEGQSAYVSPKRARRRINRGPKSF